MRMCKVSLCLEFATANSKILWLGRIPWWITTHRWHCTLSQQRVSIFFFTLGIEVTTFCQCLASYHYWGALRGQSNGAQFGFALLTASLCKFFLADWKSGLNHAFCIWNRRGGESLRHTINSILSHWSLCSFALPVRLHWTQREGSQCVFELEKWQRPLAQGVKHNSCHFISFQWHYSGKQCWAHSAESLFPVSARCCFKIRWDALIWESQERGPEEVKEMLLALLELFTDQLLFSSFILLRNSYIVFAFCVQLSTSISLSASQRAINSVLQISLSSRWTLWLIVMQHISLRTINLY